MPGSVILVTGAAGFIGSHVAHALLARGDSVVGVDNFDAFYDRAHKERNLEEIRAGSDGSFRFHEMDICEQSALSEVMRASGVTGIIHLAAKASTR